MKKIFLLFVFINTSLISQNLLQEINRNNYHSIRPFHAYEDSAYMPLRVGNIYQFIESGYGGGIVWSYLRYGTVTRDTVIMDQIYHLFNFREVNRWFRYSGSEKKLYEWLNGNDLVYMDFNLAPGDTFMHLTLPFPATVNGGDTSLFAIDYTFKGFRYPTGAGYYQERFAPGIGLFYARSERTMWPGYSNNNYSLIMAILYDSSANTQYFTNHIKPVITVTPITLISTSNFNLNFNVTHQYNSFYPPGNISLYFISSVQLESYYSKEDSIIILSPINPTSGAFSTTLDTLLLKNGFTFNYRIIAKDKGIIPETSYSPDTGYYQCVWNGPTGIDDKVEYPNTFTLHQNYPNPFNPSTVIGYQLPISGDVTLKIFDVLGREVATLVNEYKEAGYHEVEFNTSSGIRNLPAGRQGLVSGIYFYQLKAGSYNETKKMILLR